MSMHKPLAILTLLALSTPSIANAQLLDRILDRAERAATSEIEAKVDREARRATRCAMGDERCIHTAKENGGTVEIVSAEEVGSQAAAADSLQGPGTGLQPLVSLPFNHSIENAGSAGLTQLFAPYGSTRPTYEPGKRGLALAFADGGAVTIPYEFNQRANPQATVTMWLRIDEHSKFDRDLISTGFGSGLRVRLNADRSINVRSGGQVTHPRPIPLGEWVFVSAVVDNAQGFARIQQNDDAHLELFKESRAITTLPAQVPGSQVKRHHVFIGAEDFDGAIAEKRPVMLDDVRLYAGALSIERIEQIRQSVQ